MKTCDFPQCSNYAVGGFQEDIVVTNLQTSDGEEGTVGDAYYWCADHRAEMRNDFADTPGREISPQ